MVFATLSFDSPAAAAAAAPAAAAAAASAPPTVAPPAGASRSSPHRVQVPGRKRPRFASASAEAKGKADVAGAASTSNVKDEERGDKVRIRLCPVVTWGSAERHTTHLTPARLQQRSLYVLRVCVWARLKTPCIRREEMTGLRQRQGTMLPRCHSSLEPWGSDTM